MGEEISKGVELGLKLSKRIRYDKTNKGALTVPPRIKESMYRKSLLSNEEKHQPTCPMVYGVISKPGIVDNPDIMSYQPYVYGKCEPPALIPLQMNGMDMEVECWLDTAFVTVRGRWRVHCVMATKSCDCRIAVPMADQGSVLGVEVECPEKTFRTHLIGFEDHKRTEGSTEVKDGFLLKRKIYTIQVPKVAGGSLLSIKLCWSQRLLYRDGCFCLRLPYSFPSYVNPIEKTSRKEKITLNLNSGTGTEVTCECASHHLKVLRRQAGKLGLLYEGEVSTWSSNDFNFSYNVSACNISGHLLLQSPSLDDVDRREMFCLYLFSGNKNKKVFRKEVVYVVDISSSMSGGPLENVKSALLAALRILGSEDSFNIIAFNHSSLSFSTSLMLATSEAIDGATHWVSSNFVAQGGTNMSLPLNQAIRMMSGSAGSIPLIFLITDGTCEDEKEICQDLNSNLKKGALNRPRICTFGIGSYCNHYFLQMLAQIGRGCYDAAYDLESINLRMERLLQNASSVTLADLHIDALEQLDSLELHPIQVPDLLAGSPLIAFGRYSGEFPDSINISGILPDMTGYLVKVKVQRAKDMQIEKVFASRIIDSLTANAWLSGNKDTKLKVAKLSLRTGVPSEYTSMILNEEDKNQPSKTDAAGEKFTNLGYTRTIILHPLGIGFGNLKATSENLPLSASEPRLYETSEMILKAASTCCSRVVDHCCCMCFIRFCSRLSDRCAITFAQLCAALACFECFNFCFDVCCECD